MSLELPQLNSFCCGCSVKAGTIIILWAYFATGLFIASSPNMIPDSSRITADSFSEYAYAGTVVNKQEKFVLRVISVIGVIMALIQSILCGFGLYGVYMDMINYLVPFLVFTIFVQILGLVGYLFAGILHVIIGLLFFGILFYCWLVVYSYYRKVKEGVKEMDEE